MTDLEDWLNQAVHHLSKNSADLVRREIQEHYEAAMEVAISDGANPEAAKTAAIRALGDPRDANCRYRRVLLSSSEAALLRESNLEARLICSKLKWVFLSAPGTVLLGSAALFELHYSAIASGLLMLGALMALLFIAPFLPIYTPRRARAYRMVKWTLISAGIALLFGRDALNWSWLLASCIFPVFWIEWKRIMIRRKLPITQWPKQLYL